MDFMETLNEIEKAVNEMTPLNDYIQKIISILKTLGQKLLNIGPKAASAETPVEETTSN